MVGECAACVAKDKTIEVLERQVAWFQAQMQKPELPPVPPASADPAAPVWIRDANGVEYAIMQGPTGPVLDTRDNIERTYAMAEAQLSGRPPYPTGDERNGGTVQ